MSLAREGGVHPGAGDVIDGAAPVMVSPEAGHERRILLAGAVNFRDIGGYRAADGRTVKWGMLLRSDSLAELTDADVARVRSLALCSIFDLRHPHERERRPNRLPPGDAAGPAPRVHGIGFYPHGAEALMAGVRDRSLSPEQARALLLEMYRRLPRDHVPVYASLLRTLLHPDALPALIHCTSGKDRTGFAVAVVMMALGIPRRTILEDYVLTDRYRRDLSFMVGDDVDSEVLDVVKAAAPEFLQAAFGVIDGFWGGERAFLRDGLGLSDCDRIRLQDRMLEG